MTYDVTPLPNGFKILELTDTYVKIYRIGSGKERVIEFKENKHGKYFTVNNKRYNLIPVGVEEEKPILTFTNQWNEVVDILSRTEDSVTFRINDSKLHKVKVREGKYFLYLNIKYNLDKFEEVK